MKRADRHTAPFSLRLDPAHLARARRLAATEDTTVTAIIRRAIDAHLSEVA